MTVEEQTAVKAVEWLNANPAGGTASEICEGTGRPASSWPFMFRCLTLAETKGMVVHAKQHRGAAIWTAAPVNELVSS